MLATERVQDMLATGRPRPLANRPSENPCVTIETRHLQTMPLSSVSSTSAKAGYRSINTISAFCAPEMHAMTKQHGLIADRPALPLINPFAADIPAPPLKRRPRVCLRTCGRYGKRKDAARSAIPSGILLYGFINANRSVTQDDDPCARFGWLGSSPS